MLSKNALTTSAPPTSAERSGLRKAAHQLAELAKTGERGGGRERGSEREREREKRARGQREEKEGRISDEDENDRSRLGPSFRSLCRFFFLFFFFFNPDLAHSLSLSSFKNPETEDNVDSLVEGGAVRNVVPLLTMFKVDEGRGVST